jgi:hypothetical protein
MRENRPYRNEGVGLVLEVEGVVNKGTPYSYLDAICKKAFSILARKNFLERKLVNVFFWHKADIRESQILI